MHGNNLVFESWPEGLVINQNAGFFKLQYLTKKLRLEVKIMNVIGHP